MELTKAAGLAARPGTSRPAPGTRTQVQVAWTALALDARLVATGIAAVLLTVAAWWAISTPLAVAVALVLIALGAAAVVDAVDHRLPNALVGLAAVPTIVAVAVTAPWSTSPLRGALLGAVAVGGILLVLHLVSPAGLGFGDVKAGAAAGAGLGLLHPQVALVALAAASATTVLWAVATRRRFLPFGPGLVLGSVVAMAAGRLVDMEPVPWR